MYAEVRRIMEGKPAEAPKKKTVKAVLPKEGGPAVGAGAGPELPTARSFAQRKALEKKHRNLDTVAYFMDHANLSLSVDYWDGHLAYQLYDTKEDRGLRGRKGLVLIVPIPSGAYVPPRKEPLGSWSIERSPSAIADYIFKRKDWDEWANKKIMSGKA